MDLSFVPVEFWYVLVIVLCAWLFIKATKTILKVGIFIAAIFIVITYVIPHFVGM